MLWAYISKCCVNSPGVFQKALKDHKSKVCSPDELGKHSHEAIETGTSANINVVHMPLTDAQSEVHLQLKILAQTQSSEVIICNKLLKDL